MTHISTTTASVQENERSSPQSASRQSALPTCSPRASEYRAPSHQCSRQEECCRLHRHSTVMKRPSVRGRSLLDYAILTATVAASMLVLVVVVRFFASSCMVESPERFCAPFVGQGPLTNLPWLISLILLVGPPSAVGAFLSFRRKQQRPRDYHGELPRLNESLRFKVLNSIRPTLLAGIGLFVAAILVLVVGFMAWLFGWSF